MTSSNPNNQAQASQTANQAPLAPAGSHRYVSAMLLAALLVITSGLLFTLDSPSMPSLGMLVLGALAALAAFFTGGKRPRRGIWLGILAAALTMAAGVWGPLSTERLFHEGSLPRIYFMGLDAMSVPLLGALAALAVSLFLGAPALAGAGRKTAPILATVGVALFAVLWVLPQPSSRFVPVDTQRGAVDDLVVMDARGDTIVPLVFKTADGPVVPILGWTDYKNNALATALMPVNPGPVQYLGPESDQYSKALRRIQESRLAGARLHPIAFWTWLAVLLAGFVLVAMLWIRKYAAARYLGITAAVLVAYVPVANLVLAAKSFSSGLFDVSLTSLLAPAFLDLAALAALVVLLKRPTGSS